LARGVIIENNDEGLAASYAWSISSSGTVAPAQLTTANLPPLKSL
jgi:hypothetical protein